MTKITKKAILEGLKMIKQLSTLTAKEIKKYLTRGEIGHAELFYRTNMDNFVITSMKGTEGYYWNSETKLWDELFASSFISMISVFLTSQIDLVEKSEISKIKKSEKKITISSDDEHDMISEKLLEINKQKARTAVKISAVKKNTAGIRKSCNSARHNEQVIKFLAKDYFDKNFMSKLDSHKSLLPIKGKKIIDLKTLKERERSKNDYFTYEIDCTLLPEDKTPHADKFFSQIMCDDKEKTEYFQKSLGYTITGEVSQKCLFIMIGPGGDNAKSATMQLIKVPFDKHYTAVQKDVIFSLGDKKREKDLGPYIAELLGKRVGVYNEPSDGMEMNEPIIKALTGNDEQTAKKLYRDPFTFTPIIKIWIMSNKYIRFDSTSEPMKRRCKIFKMNAHFTDNEILLKENDKLVKEKGAPRYYRKDESFVDDLKTKYKNEVFSWIIRGAYKYYKDGHLNAPEISNNEMKEYIEIIDPVSSFVNDECVQDNKLRIDRTILFEAYIDWCKSKDEKMLNREKFYLKLESHKFIPKIINGRRFFQGLNLNINQESTNEIEQDPTDYGIDKTDKSIVPQKIEKKVCIKKQCEQQNFFAKVPNKVPKHNVEMGDSDDDFGGDHGENYATLVFD